MSKKTRNRAQMSTSTVSLRLTLLSPPDNRKTNSSLSSWKQNHHFPSRLVMATTTFSSLNTGSPLSLLRVNHQRHSRHLALSLLTRRSFISKTLSLKLTSPFLVFSAPGNAGDHGGNFGGGGGDGGSGGGGEESGDASKRNKTEAILALAEVGRSLDSIPKDLAAAIEAGRIPGSIVVRYFELEKSPLFRWLLNFGGFEERLLADDLFLTKVGIECRVGIFTKTAAELEKRKEKFSKELDFVFADVVMAVVADFMLVWLPAPTVSLKAPLAVSAGRLSKFFYSCPDNAFQVALAGTSYSLIHRIGAIVRNGAKLFAVGASASLIGTGVTNALIAARKAVDKTFAGEAEDLPILPTSVAYGVYMAVSSNLRYQILAGVIEQRMLEPLLHNQKLLLSAICFAVRTGNTFLGSLMWVDYARWVGVQRSRE